MKTKNILYTYLKFWFSIIHVTENKILSITQNFFSTQEIIKFTDIDNKIINQRNFAKFLQCLSTNKLIGKTNKINILNDNINSTEIYIYSFNNKYLYKKCKYINAKHFDRHWQGNVTYFCQFVVSKK